MWVFWVSAHAQGVVCNSTQRCLLTPKQSLLMHRPCGDSNRYPVLISMLFPVGLSGHGRYHEISSTSISYSLNLFSSSKPGRTRDPCNWASTTRASPTTTPEIDRVSRPRRPTLHRAQQS